MRLRIEVLIYRTSKGPRPRPAAAQINIPGTADGSSTCSLNPMEVGADDITLEQIYHQRHHRATGSKPNQIPFQKPSPLVHQLENLSADVHHLQNKSAPAHQLFVHRQGLPQKQQPPHPHTSLGIVNLSVSMQTASFSNLASVERPRTEEPQATGSAGAKLPPLRRPKRVTQISVVQNMNLQTKRKLPPIGTDVESVA